MQLFVRGVDDCQALVAIPPGQENARDALRETSTIVQWIRVECWTLLQADPQARVTSTGLADRITPGMIHGIMDYSRKLAEANTEWSQTLFRFPGGEITCADEWRCLLSLPDGNNPPDQSLEFDLILATGDERFVKVTQLFRGQSGFVYGVRWRETEGGGAVNAIFPELH